MRRSAASRRWCSSESFGEGLKGRRLGLFCRLAAKYSCLQLRDIFNEIVISHLKLDNAPVFALATVAINIEALKTPGFPAHGLIAWDKFKPRWRDHEHGVVMGLWLRRHASDWIVPPAF